MVCMMNKQFIGRRQDADVDGLAILESVYDEAINRRLTTDERTRCPGSQLGAKLLNGHTGRAAGSQHTADRCM